MHFTDKAILTSVRRHAETGGIVRAFTRAHGLYAGMVHGVAGKSKRGMFQPGNLALLTWSARVAEQVGTFSGELIEPIAAFVIQDAARLTALSSACMLTELSVPEREPHPELYDALESLVHALKEDACWQQAYAFFELELLSSCGFRLDFSACAGTGTTEDLCYVSPKSGRAVSRAAGEPYKEKLFHLPAFLIRHPRAGGDPSIHSASGESDPRLRGDDGILSALTLTGYFLHHWLLEPHGRTLPAARERLIRAITKENA